MDEVKTSTALIAVTRLPEIKENLRSLRERWEQKAKDAASLVCTDESVQSVKAMRAEMRKEFDEADRQRKEAKDRYMAAWNEVESTWKECVSEPFKSADASYKATIDGFESTLKTELREKLAAYFSELCAAEKIDFLTFDRALQKGGIKINLTDAKAKTPRKLQDALAAMTAQIATDMERISRMEDAAEIMTEYKRTLDFGAAVDTVHSRKRAIEAEREAAERRKEEAARQQEMVAKVEAAAPAPAPVAAPTAVKAAELELMTDRPTGYWKKMSFTIYFRNPGEYEKVLPALRQLKEILKQEEIQYGK